MTTAATDQLATELDNRLAALHQLARHAHSESPDTIDPTALIDALTIARPGTAAAVAQAVLDALWPAGPPEHWWQTPLARPVAAALAPTTPPDQTITMATAGRLLGRGHTRIRQLVADGALTSPAGSKQVTLASVYARIGRGHAGHT